MGRKNKGSKKKNLDERDQDDERKFAADSIPTVSGGGGGHVLVMDQSGSRLDGFIATELGYSRSRVVRAAKAGMIIVDNKVMKASSKLKPGVTIHYRDAELPKLTVAPEDHNLVILYEDEDLLVVDKPAGMAVHPAGGLVSGTLVNALLFHLGKPTIEIEVSEEEVNCQESRNDIHSSTVSQKTNKNVNDASAASNVSIEGIQEKVSIEDSIVNQKHVVDDDDDDDDTVAHSNAAELKQGIVRPGIVHRLDRFTSGVMVVAKEQSTHAHLHAQFGAKTTDRSYEAILCGVPAEVSGKIRGKIGRDVKNRLRMAMVGDNDSIGPGKSATTNYHIIKSYPRCCASHVKLVLETGRTHQIRVHCSSEPAVGGLGMPLLGDDVYGGGGLPVHMHKNARLLPAELRSCINRQSLHARSLGFTHPRTGERLSFSAEPPADFNNAIQFLNKHG